MTTTTQIHGHRGCDDAVPPNTIPAFLRATATGCQWLEMDVVITGDDHVLVSHEPWMDHLTCIDPEGRVISEKEGRAINIFRMPLAEVQRYGCLPARDNSGVNSISSVPKPTLAEMVHAVRNLAKDSAIPVPGFNIEVKSDPRLYGSYQPAPSRFAELVVQDVITLGIAEHCIIQSFDTAILETVHLIAAQIPLALLVDNTDGSEINLDRLSFTPAYYSTAFSLASAQMRMALQSRGIGLLVWTVNEEADMQRMLDLGVAGLITDRPRAALALLAQHH